MVGVGVLGGHGSSEFGGVVEGVMVGVVLCPGGCAF